MTGGHLIGLIIFLALLAVLQTQETELRNERAAEERRQKDLARFEESRIRSFGPTMIEVFVDGKSSAWVPSGRQPLIKDERGFVACMYDANLTHWDCRTVTGPKP